jgi:uncharacterized protein (DUF1810 family)
MRALRSNMHAQHTAQSDDPYRLARFISAQEAGQTYSHAVEELRRGRKTSHWMWFVFPQIAGLGSSSMAQTYAIGSLDEARAYLRHPVLGPRLLAAAQAVLDSPAQTAEQLLGGIDAVKLRSSMTLFLRADPAQTTFQQVLDRYYHGRSDPATDQRL